MPSLLSIYLCCDFNIKSNISCKADSIFLAFNITDKMKNDDGHALYIHCPIHYYNMSQVLEQTEKKKGGKNVLYWYGLNHTAVVYHSKTSFMLHRHNSKLKPAIQYTDAMKYKTKTNLPHTNSL